MASDDLSDEEQVLRTLLDLAPDAIITADADGRIRRVNALCRTMFGYVGDELIGQPVEILIPEKHRERHPEFRTAYLASPSIRPMGVGRDLSGQRKDGSEFPVTVTLSTIERQGELQIVAAVHDMSDRVAAEKARLELESRLQQAERLESVGQLAGGIAHDFNNLLAVILNYAAFVASAVEDPEIARDVEQIRIAAERGAALTKQLLLFSRLQPSTPEAIDLDEVLSQLAGLLHRTIGEHVELDIAVDSAGPKVRADRTKLEQVLFNLIVNARDAMPDGGRVVVRSAVVEYDATLEWKDLDLRSGTYVRLTVTDTGIGMESEVADRAFEPFFTTKPRGRGTGLGLATVYGIVTEAGGAVRLYTEVGQGTTVSVYLPVAFGDDVAAVRTVMQPLDGSGLTVLVVEDESAVRAIAERILARSGFSVVAVGDGDSAIAAADAGMPRPALVLSDVVMPGVSGPDLVTKLRERWPDIPALLMSGYPADDAHKGSEIDLPLLHKPFTEAGLLAHLRALLADQ